METYTTDDALTLMGFGKFQALVLAYAGTVLLAEAMEVMLLSFLGPVMREDWNVSPQDESLLSSVVFAGMLTGAFVWGFVSDRYERKFYLRDALEDIFSSHRVCGVKLLPAFLPRNSF